MADDRSLNPQTSKGADTAASIGAPMSEDCQVRGYVTSSVDLTLAGVDLPWGKWVNGPNGSVSKGSGVLAFQAWGAKGTATGTEGTVTYQTPDSAQFALYFNDPYSGTNQCTISGVKGPITGYTISCSYPQSGSSWNVTYTIAKKS
jgi:hypothetical protein